MNNTKSDQTNLKKNNAKAILNVLYVSLGGGFLVILLYASKTSPAKFLSLDSVAMLLASASFGAGGLLGFLFGIPISLQQPITNSCGKNPAVTDSQSVAKPSEPKYRGNTNLEEISNWLTKMLVGIGLTQIPAILTAIKKYSIFASPSLGGEPSGKVFAISILIYFSICGFIAAYMWTRLNLVNMFTEAENPITIQVARQKISKLLNVFVKKLYKLKDVQHEQIGELTFDEEENDWKVLKLMGDTKIVAMYRPYGDGIVLAFGHDFLLDNVEEEEEKEEEDIRKKNPEITEEEVTKAIEEARELKEEARKSDIREKNPGITEEEVTKAIEEARESKEKAIEEARESKEEAIEVIFDEILNHDNNKKRVIVSSKHGERFTISKRPPYNLNNLRKILGNLGYTIEEIGEPITDSELKKGDILIVGNAWNKFKDNEINAVQEFVFRGNSLFVIGVGPSWLSSNCNHPNSGNEEGQDKKDIWTYPMNKLVEPYKMRFSGNRVNPTQDGQS